MTKLQTAGMWKKEQTRPEEALTQGTVIMGERDLQRLWLTGRELLGCPTEQVLEDNSSVVE